MEIKTNVTVKEWEVLGKVIYPNKSVIFIHAVALICLYFSYLYKTQGNQTFAILYIVIPIVLEAFVNFSRYRLISGHKKYFLDNYEGKEMILDYSFRDDGFSIHNLLTNDRTDYKYDILAEFFDFEEHMVIAAYGNQFFIFHKKDVEERNLKEFLLKKNPNIKKARKKIFGIF